MHIIRYHTSESPAPLVGVRDEGQVFGLPGVGSLAALWALPVAEIRQRVAERERVPAGDVTLLPPIDGRTEVWAAGVTYFSSRRTRSHLGDRNWAWPSSFFLTTAMFAIGRSRPCSRLDRRPTHRLPPPLPRGEPGGVPSHRRQIFVIGVVVAAWPSRGSP